MTGTSVQALIRALNQAGVRYLVAGGLAVVAHGHVRFTADVDLILDLEEDNLRSALGVLEGLGYRPRAPVPLRQFADTDTRERWIRDKGLTVLSLFSDAHPLTEVDLFAADPLGFDGAYPRRATLLVAPDVEATFVGLDDLIRMKRAAGRPQDLVDVEQLENLRRDRGDT